MKKSKRYYTLFTIVLLSLSTIISCEQASKQEKNMKEINEWLETGSWKNGLKALPHSSVNKDALYSQYHKNPELWKSVFTFFNETNLKSLEPGKYEIDEKKAIAIIAEYPTKNSEDAKWEAHEKFIDLQYVVKGKEKMGIMSIQKAILSEEYNSEKDLAFYKDGEGEYFDATPEEFFLFFPSDVHRPSLKINESTTVKKLIIKIAFTE